MTSVSQLGYLGLKVSNLDAWENFATQILGIESVGRNENSGYKAGNIGEFCSRWGHEHDFAEL